MAQEGTGVKKSSVSGRIECILFFSLQMLSLEVIRGCSTIKT